MKKMILLLLLLWLFTGCASTEQTVSEAESSGSEQLLSSCESESSVQELEAEENPTPWLAEEPIRCGDEQIQLSFDELYQTRGFLVGEYWVSIRWNSVERTNYIDDRSFRLFPPNYSLGSCKNAGAILGEDSRGEDYLVGFKESGNYEEYLAAYDEKRPVHYAELECFIFQDGEFRSYPVESWHQSDSSLDPPLEISYDPDTRTAEVSSILMTAKVQMDTGETATKFSTERLKKANEETQYGVYSIDEALLASSDGKYEIGAIGIEVSSFVYFSRNTQTGEETYLAYGYIPESEAAILKDFFIKQGREEELYEKEMTGRRFELASMDNVMRLDGYTLYFPYWDIAYNIETGEQIE
ncbi:hypothetical protein [Anaerotruncus colihominis]|uniref:Uncharacterized protein n=2 Tax=Anaerotruncus colihominis TaxID=169435 RepID=A0A845RNC6_9FIRM|nr:hypothetical protein [Anaerotruncus colihominis]MCR2024878.1 hypothetical protein [Anaerotruncus colihominis]NBI79162.1 hypothetical protein [Anaerotruncus colihominis]NDO40270.1 hypothetical protein [Anaerotruncus colihominis]